VVDEIIGPQCTDRQRHLLSGAQRAQHGGVRVAGDQVDQRGGRRVEQVGVVDREHHPAAGGLAVQRVDGPSQQPGRRHPDRLVAGEHLGQPAERQPGHRDAGRRGPDRVSLGR
jgi:hypothetical protein